jgi:hydrogenase maturation protease
MMDRDSLADYRTLIAGVGNIFLSDDAFGVAVVRRLAGQPLPPGVRVADFGIRSVHLAYEILEKKYDTVIIVDAMARGGSPGDLYLLEPCQDQLTGYQSADAHSMNPDAVIALLRKLGAIPKRLLVVGCEPLTLEEDMGLSDPVEQAVDKAVPLILKTLKLAEPIAAEASPVTGEN